MTKLSVFLEIKHPPQYFPYFLINKSMLKMKKTILFLAFCLLANLAFVLLLEKAEKNEIDLGYGEPPLYARPVAYSIAKMQEKAGKMDKSIEKYQELLKRFPKSAMVYFELLKNYRKKGDAEKVKEFESKLKEATQYADKGMFGVIKK